MTAGGWNLAALRASLRPRRIEVISEALAFSSLRLAVWDAAFGDGRIVLTIDVNGAIELRSFDLDTLKPLGSIRFNSHP